MPHDPFPDRVLLTAQQAMRLLSLDRTTFYSCAESEPLFPKAVIVGRNSKGQPVKRYRKRDLLCYVELIRPDSSQSG